MVQYGCVLPTEHHVRQPKWLQLWRRRTKYYRRAGTSFDEHVAQQDDPDQRLPRARAAHLRERCFQYRALHFHQYGGEFTYLRGGHGDGRHAAGDNASALPVLKEEEHAASEKNIFDVHGGRAGITCGGACPCPAERTSRIE